MEMMKCEIKFNYVTFSFDSIVLKFDGDKLWIEKTTGEAMEVSDMEIETLLEKYFLENF